MFKSQYLISNYLVQNGKQSSVALSKKYLSGAFCFKFKYEFKIYFLLSFCKSFMSNGGEDEYCKESNRHKRKCHKSILYKCRLSTINCKGRSRAWLIDRIPELHNVM